MTAAALFSAITVACSSVTADPSATAGGAVNYLYTSIGEFESQAKPLLARPDIAGVQVVVPWKMMERQEGEYDFAEIENVLREVNALHKKMYVQLQDRFFEPEPRMPKYLLTDPQYAGGVTEQRSDDGPVADEPPGSVAAQWNEPLRKRWQLMVREFAKKFDGRIEGVNLPESAVSVEVSKDKTGYTCDGYFRATIENMSVTKKVFKKSQVVQYLNFWPCDGERQNNDNMAESIQIAQQHGIGVGGPDLLPNNKAHMENGYKFIHDNKGTFSVVAVAVQEPDFEYTNPKTGKKYTRQDFVDFANDYLGANIIFWSTIAPWLHENDK